MAREVGKGRYKKAKEARSIDISQTEWKEKVAGAKGKAGRLVGPKGQFFTGTVKMEDGSKVVYEKGKRVSRATTAGGGVTKAQASAQRKSQSSAPATASKPKTPTPKATESKKPTITTRPSGAEGPKRPVKKITSATPQPKTPIKPGQKGAYKRNPVADRPRPQGGNLTRQDIALDRARREGPQGPLANLVRKGVAALTSRGAAKPGDTRVSGGGRYKQVYRNGKWVTTHTKNSSGRWVKKT